MIKNSQTLAQENVSLSVKETLLEHQDSIIVMK